MVVKGKLCIINRIKITDTLFPNVYLNNSVGLKESDKSQISQFCVFADFNSLRCRTSASVLVFVVMWSCGKLFAKKNSNLMMTCFISSEKP